MVVFMLKHLRLAGCPFPADSIQCHPCPKDMFGGFAPEYGVLLCQNKIPTKSRMEDTIAHELIHAFDHCRFKVDWSNLRHHACTEVRHLFSVTRSCSLCTDSSGQFVWRLPMEPRGAGQRILDIQQATSGESA